MDRESLPEELESTIQKKSDLIEEMERLDAGFDEVSSAIDTVKNRNSATTKGFL